MVAEDDAEGMADWVGEDPEACFVRMCPIGLRVAYQCRSARWVRGEPACRPGSVTPSPLTCGHFPGRPSGLRGYYVVLRDVTGRFGC